MIPDDNPASGSKSEASGGPAVRPRGRSRHSRGRRGPRRPPRSPRPPEAQTAGDTAPQSPAPEFVAESDAAANAEHEPARSPAPRSKGEPHPTAPPVPKGRAIYAAIDKVDAIIVDLKDVLNDLDLVMEYLEDIERQQITDEREIEMLRSRLESIHRRVDRSHREGERPREPRRHEPRREHQQEYPKQQSHEEAPESDSP